MYVIPSALAIMAEIVFFARFTVFQILLFTGDYDKNRTKY